MKRDTSLNVIIKNVLLVLLDAVTIFAAILLSFIMIRAIRTNPTHMGKHFFLHCGIFVVAGLLGIILFKAYHRLLNTNFLADFFRCFMGFITGEVILGAIYYFAGKRHFIIFNLLCIVVSAIALTVERLIYYLAIVYHRRLTDKSKYPAALIIGAGEAGRLVASEINHSNEYNYHIIGYVDDDPKKIGRYLDDYYVYGPTLLIPELCSKHKIDTLFFAISNCSESHKEHLLSLCAKTNCNIITVPSFSELIDTKKLLPQMRTVNIEDLLGRESIRIKNPKTADLINNSVVMVTGVGSIGSELCRQIIKLGPKKLVMVDIYENNAYDIQQELKRSGFAERIVTEIASVRDEAKMRLLFKTYKPNVVFHAAAHKHVPLMEDNPEEAVKNNIFGTYTVAKLCNEFNTEKMVLISTDKAVNPTNVMGATKRVCEMVMQYYAQTTAVTSYITVRFGNVLGSNGSVIPLFTKQIEMGGPVTVTHPDIIRYFMTIPEAVSLVMEAATIGNKGEILVLDMGDPVKITTLAENLIKAYGLQPYTQIPIVFTGLRPGEKLFEELLMAEEGLKETENEKIFIGKQIDITPEAFLKQLSSIKSFANNNNKEAVVQALTELVPTFSHK